MAFTAQPAAITSGQTTTLSWVIQNATSASIYARRGYRQRHHRFGSGVAHRHHHVYPHGDRSQRPTTQTVQVTVGATSAQILRFAAGPSSIATGAQSTLSWSTSGATTVSISPGIGTVAANGSTTVSPATTTTYTISATGTDGNTVTAAVQVTVGAVTAQIVRFAASPSSIATGGQATLSWSTTNATTVSISPGIGSVAANGSTTVSPAATTVYTISATGTDGNTVTATVQVTVGAVTAQILRFAASPSTIAAGAQTTLSWTTSDATTVSISPGIGTRDRQREHHRLAGRHHQLHHQRHRRGRQDRHRRDNRDRERIRHSADRDLRRHPDRVSRRASRPRSAGR